MKSLLWNSIVSHDQRLRSIGNWVVERGEISFWNDNWLGEILIGPLPCDIHLTVRDGLPIIDQLQHYLPDHLKAKVCEIFISDQHQDQLQFSCTKNGEFSSKKYMEVIRPAGHKRSWVDIVWHTFLPLKITTFMWKLMRQALSVDNRIICKSIQMASKCRCCKEPDVESIRHLCLQSEKQVKYGDALGEKFRLPTRYLALGQVLRVWLPKMGAVSQFDICHAWIASFSLWEIWVARCGATFEGTKMNARRICLRVIARVQPM